MNMKKIKRGIVDDRGFTLIELVAFLAIMAIILVPLTSASLHGIAAYYQEQEKIELMESGQFAFFRISKQIRMSNKPVVVNENNDTIVIVLNGKSYEYRLIGKNLKEIENSSGVKNTIAENINTFDVITSDSGNLLTIDLELEGPKYGENVHLTTSIFLRNQ